MCMFWGGGCLCVRSHRSMCLHACFHMCSCMCTYVWNVHMYMCMLGAITAAKGEQMYVCRPSHPKPLLTEEARESQSREQGQAVWRMLRWGHSPAGHHCRSFSPPQERWALALG